MRDAGLGANRTKLGLKPACLEADGGVSGSANRTKLGLKPRAMSTSDNAW